VPRLGGGDAASAAESEKKGRIPACQAGELEVDGRRESGSECRVQILLTVGGTDDYAALALEAVKLSQQHPQDPACGFVHLGAAASVSPISPRRFRSKNNFSSGRLVQEKWCRMLEKRWDLYRPFAARSAD
jgi:hypothetical protein